MKLTNVLYTMLVNSMFFALFFALAASVSAYKDKKKDTYRKALIFAYLILGIQHARPIFSPTSGALCDPYRLPDLHIVEFLNATMPSPPGSKCRLQGFPMVDGPNVIQVWRVRASPLPELTGRPSLESEEELNGVVDPQEIAIRQVTDPGMAVERPLLPELTIPLERHPIVYSIRPMRDPPYPETVRRAIRRQRYIEDLETRIQEVRADPTLMLVRGTLDSLIRELRRVRGPRHRPAPIMSRPPVRPVQDLFVPEDVRRANRLEHYIEELERRIHNLRNESRSTPDRGTLDSLMHELRGARAARDRQDLVARANFSPNVSSNASLGPGRHVTQMVFRGIQQINASNPTIVTPQIHREAVRAVIEDPATDDSTTPNLIAEDTRGRSDRAFTEEPTTDDTSSLDSASEEEIRPDIQSPLAAALPHSIPEHDATLDQNDPASQRHLGSEDSIGATPLRSVPDHDATLDQTDPVPQRQLVSEDTIGAAPLRSVPDHDGTLDQTNLATQPHLGSEDTTRGEATGTME